MAIQIACTYNGRHLENVCHFISKLTWRGLEVPRYIYQL